MLSRTIVIAAVVSASFSSWSAGAVHAQDSSAVPAFAAQQEPAAFPASGAGAAQLGQLGQFPARIAREAPKPRGGLGLMSLYASTVALQAMDVHSTLTAFNQGAVEGNPVMRGVTSNKAVFFATKAAVTATTVFVAHRIAKRNRTTAMIFLAAANTVYAAIVINNYKVARSMR
jgi:hypothetical protein